MVPAASSQEEIRYAFGGSRRRSLKSTSWHPSGKCAVDSAFKRRAATRARQSVPSIFTTHSSSTLIWCGTTPHTGALTLAVPLPRAVSYTHLRAHETRHDL